MQNLLTDRTRCLLVRPGFLDRTFYNLTDIFKLLGAKSAAPPLGLLVVAALLPERWQLEFVDEDVEELTDAHLDWADVVMVSGIGPQERSSLNIVDRAQALGKPVVVGGAGPTLQPEVYERADYVACGEAETTLPRILDDLARGVSQGLYRATERADLTQAVVPRYDLATLDAYLFVGVQFCRGCPFNCEFCAQIEVFGREPRTKAPAQVLRELQTLYDLGYRGMVDFGYDNLIGDIPRATEMLEALVAWQLERGHPFFFATEATMNVARQTRILELMRDADFRNVFLGIESGDEDVLDGTQKGQNTAMSAQDAVGRINSHGILVYTGLIVGFDGESDKTADNMLAMIERTGAFPALVLPLHALPNTQLSRRLAREGRLFDGSIKMNTGERTDTATTGLNFVTSRPRPRVLRDLATVLEQLYVPKNHYARVALTTSQLRPRYRYKPGLLETLRLGRAFVRIATSIGLDRDSGPLFWKTLAKVLLTNPGAAEIVISLAVMNANYARQASSYVKALRAQADDVERMGEDAFNQRMLGPSAQPTLSLAYASS